MSLTDTFEELRGLDAGTLTGFTRSIAQFKGVVESNPNYTIGRALKREVSVVTEAALPREDGEGTMQGYSKGRLRAWSTLLGYQDEMSSRLARDLQNQGTTFFDNENGRNHYPVASNTTQKSRR